MSNRPPRLPRPADPGEVVMAAAGVFLTLGGSKILDGVDIAVRAGQTLALVGPNGAGKSTLLGVLAGDHKPEAGAVTLAGQALGAWTAQELALRRGVLLQHVDVTFPFTVTQIVRMGRAPWAGTAAEDWDDHVVAESMADTDVLRFAERVFRSLSGGERARAALARVLAQEPGALLLDEPTAALDIRHQELMLALARRRALRGDAVVVVLHDLGHAAAHADVVALMHRGKVVAYGPPPHVFTAARLSEVYEHPIEVLVHPRTGELLILPQRAPRGRS